MDNRSVARVLNDIAVLLQAKGDSVFKVRAYTRAADSIDNLGFELSDIVEDEGKLREIPGFGDAIVSKVQELVRTGKLEYYEKLRQELPEGVLTLAEIPGIGPKTAYKAASELGISTREQLVESIESGAFAQLPRMGEKNAHNILRHLRARMSQGDRIGIGVALPLAEALMEEIKSGCRGVRNLAYAGSLRRGRETVGDLDLLCSADDPGSVTEALTKLPRVVDVLGQGTTKASVVVEDGLQVDLRVVDDTAYAATLLYFTGSKQHGVRIRDRALKQGLSLNEYGLTDLESGELKNYPTEADIYEELGLQFFPPEMREDTGEIEAAEEGTLPEPVTRKEIVGDLHSHTDWTDGHATLEDMAKAAIEQGFRYLAVTDHSVSATVAGGLDADRLRDHNGAVRELDSMLDGIELLTGTEMDILPDGALDYTDDVLEDLDVVLGSIHSAMDQDRKTMTERIVKAMKSEHVDIIAHLTTRLIGERSRAPVDVDVEEIFRTAVETGTVMEINGSTSRLDLKDSHVRLARDMGVIFSISTDSHRPTHFDFMRYGVLNARRGWCEKWRVINAMQPSQLRKFLALPKSERYEYAMSLA